MHFISKGNNTLQNSVIILLLLSATVVAMAANNQTGKTRTSAPQPAPRPSTPVRQLAPTARPSTPTPSRPSAPTYPSTNNLGRATTRTTMPSATGGNTGAKTETVGKNEKTTVAKAGTAASLDRSGGAAKGVINPTSLNRPPAGREISLKGGGTASLRPNGQIRSIDRNGMHIEQGPNGSRRIESTRNGARIVSTAKNSGYVQRPYVTRNGYTYVSRTTVVNSVTYTAVYRSYSYGGYCCYYSYYPAFYYTPVFYGWAYNPWPAPVYFGWGWGAAPWYGYYGWYFAPYPVYPAPAFWLTDYLIATHLQAAYAAQAATDTGAVQQTQASENTSTPAASSGPVTLSPEVKQAIVEEVKAQLAAEQAAATQRSSGGQQPASEEVPPALDPARRTFIVATDLVVPGGGQGQECGLTEGDVLTRISDTPDQDRKVNVSVSASKKGDCSAGKQVAVAVDDLQEMHNHFEEQLDKGMQELASKQGTGGLPKAPDVRTVAAEIPPPPPDPNAVKTLQDQQAIADQTEAQVVKEAFSQGS